MVDKSIAEIAEQVSLLMQIDRNHSKISSAVDMAALANLPTHIASVFERANMVGGELTPSQVYSLVNKRISELQAQVYLMRLELENRQPHDPASIYEDPLVISAYGDRLEKLCERHKSFGFGPEILADGWYPMEVDEDRCYRWMRPGKRSVACVPHLGDLEQTLTIQGYVMHAEQMEGLAITAAGQTANIVETESSYVIRFEAVLKLAASDVCAANYLPIEFHCDVFKTPNEMDGRMLGANIEQFTCTSLQADSDVAP